MLKNCILLLLAAAALAACSGKPAVDVATYDKVNQTFNVKYVEVKVTSKVDKIEIQNVVVNRGNCKIEKIREMFGGKTLPKTLEYGETAEFSFSGPCSASEVEVDTDQGSWTWNY